MKIRNIHADISFELWFIPLISDSIPIEQIKKFPFRIKAEINGDYSLVINHIPIPVQLRDREQAIDLDFYLKRGCAHLAETIQIVEAGGSVNCIFVKIVFFTGKAVEMEEVLVGIDEKILETAQNKNIRFTGIDDFCKLLLEKCSIDDENDTYFLMLCGAAAEKDFEEVESDAPHAFALYGERVVIPVEKRRINAEREAFFAAKIIFKDPQKGKGSFRLVHGKLKFVDFSRSGEQSEIKLLAQAALRSLNDEPGSYLRVWDKYSKAEGTILLNRARAIDTLVLQTSEPVMSAQKIFLKEPLPEALKAGDFLEIVDRIPIYLADKTMDWDAYQESFISHGPEDVENQERKSKIICQVQGVSITENSITVDLETPPAGGSMFVFSIMGDETQIKRRQTARQSILEARCANPLLGVLISENGVPPATTRVTRIEPLSPFVRKKIFHNEPREAQKKAIEIALNTPDFALIQGPPGTGKTTVISAILERLNEIYDKTGNLRGKILVSGSQHDAVENILSRLSINSIPTAKFGKRYGDAGHNENIIDQTLDKWCDELKEKIKMHHQNNDAFNKNKQNDRLQELFEIYAGTPGNITALEILNFIIELPRGRISEENVNQAQNIKELIGEEDTEKQSEKLRLIRSLRVTPEGFAEDGADRALETLDVLEDELDDEIRDILSTAAQWKAGTVLSFLNDLKEKKRRLLLKYTPSIHFRIEKPRSDMIELIGNVREELERTQDDKDRRNTALVAFFNDLDKNPDGIKETLADYSLVFASTVQFAGSNAMARAKMSGMDAKVVFDTVIIDEAARVNPMDLLIPLSQAEKRIILVGDHRQLPQLVDDDIIETALAGEIPLNADTYRELYEKSMFGYLFNRLQKLEAQDGIPRIVTLDAQFRMHPILGNFISDNFYRNYGEEFESPLPADNFNNNLPETRGKAAIWFNIPNKRGGHEKRGTSWGRKAEAEEIAKLLAKWIDYPDPDGGLLSFGVISFYKAQVDLLLEALLLPGISIRNDDGSLRLNDTYAKRLRIGTVDSFQGMEFDVVFLSMVRSRNVNDRPISDGLKKSTFGFLMSVNRLCVGMSRQKRLLVVAGDADLVQTKLAREAVPALYQFYQLCKSNGVII